MIKPAHYTLGVFLFLFSSVLHAAYCAPPSRAYFQIRIYHFADKSQESDIDNFLKLSYLPALHRAGVAKVGVFKPVASDTAGFGKRIYVFIPYASFEDVEKVDGKLQKDQVYLSSANPYWTATYDHPPYARMETILLKSFADMPIFEVPALSGPIGDRIYELRSYEGPTEKIFANKVQMFNQGGEIVLFKQLGFNAVFYSEVVAGSKMPNLMYMTSFNNMASHDEHWKSFVDSPVWKKLSSQPEYQHNVSRIEIFLLHPTDYSEL